MNINGEKITMEKIEEFINKLPEDLMVANFMIEGAKIRLLAEIYNLMLGDKNDNT